MADFWEALKIAAKKQLQPPMSLPEKLFVEAGILATIKAEQEMMVGEPIKARIVHQVIYDKPFTTLSIKEAERPQEGTMHWRYTLPWSGHHGTDGEEVAVLVVRTGERNENENDQTN